MSINTTTTFAKIMSMTKKIKVIQGGQAAGKNYGIAEILLNEAFNNKCTITIMTDTYDNLKDGVIADFKNIFSSGGLNFDKAYNKSAKDLKVGKSVIQFRYISDKKEHAGKSKRRDILYLNEANKIGWGIASTYIGRTHGDVYIDYNPDREFWAHTEIPKLKDKEGNSISEHIIVTYKDNEFCPESEIQYIESRKDNESWYRVYGLGQTGFYSDRLIYSYKFSDIPPDAKRIASGMDFGLSPDPTCLVDLYIKDADLYADEIFQENNLMVEKLQGTERMSVVDKMEEVKFPKGWMIWGDSANKSNIKDLTKHEYNIRPVKKYPGSVIDGIKILRSYNLHLTPRSTNIKKACESWFFKIDTNGKIVPEPDGHEPDTLAAIRYAIMMNAKVEF